MSKKLKITEEQLKRLMMVNEQHEGDVNESIHGIVMGATKEKLKKDLGREPKDHEVEGEISKFYNKWKKDNESKKKPTPNKKEIEESAAGGVGLSLIPTKLEDMTASYIRQVKEILSQSPVHNGQFMYDQLLEQLSNGLTMGGNEDEYDGDELPSNRDVDMSIAGELPSKRDEDMETEYEINESIKKIKSEFNRFL